MLPFSSPFFHLAQPQSQQDLLADLLKKKKTRKSKAQAKPAWESQERFERAGKSGGQARKEIVKERFWAKHLEPRKERVIAPAM